MSKNKNIKYIIMGIFGIGIIFIVTVFYFIATNKAQNNSGKILAEVHYSPTCGCCINYIGYLRNNGFKINAIKIDNLEKIKNELKIPKELQSCHTTKIGSYFVEGHIPVEAINKLLQESPDIDGIALPYMPSGSPGMSGPKKAPFSIKSVKDGKDKGVFVTI